jgi:hypothetical protein
LEQDTGIGSPDPADDMFRDLVTGAPAIVRSQPRRWRWRPTLQPLMVPTVGVALVAVAAVAIAATSGGGDLDGGRIPIAVPDRTGGLTTAATADPPSVAASATTPDATLSPPAVVPPATLLPPSSAGAAPPLVLSVDAVPPVADAPMHSAPPPPGRAAAPRNVAAFGRNASAVVRWLAPTDDGGSAVRHYVVTRYPGRVRHVSSATRLTVGGLVNGRAYAFTVLAVTSAGDGAESGASNSVVPATVPGAPRAVSAVDSDRAATVSWRPPASTGGATVLDYELVVSPGGHRVRAAGSPAVVGGLTNGTAYTFTVRARNRVGFSRPSGKSAAVTPAGLPHAPGGATARAGDGSATVSWRPADGNGAAVRDYVVTVTPGGRRVTASSTSSNSRLTIGGLSNGTAYRFTVAARNRVGTGAASSPSNVVTPKWVTRLTIARSASLVTFGNPVTISGRLTKVRGGGGLGGVSVSLLARRAGAVAYTRIGTATTTSTGNVRFTRRPAANTAYRLSFAGTGSAVRAQTAGVGVRVRALFRLDNPTSMRATAGQTFTIYGSLSPRHAGQTVRLHQKSGTRWVYAGARKLTSTSRFSFALKRARGTYYFRVYFPGDADHVKAVSRTVKVVVS